MPKQADPKPWERDQPGRYRSADGRFAIEQGDPGRWFLVDEESRDEFGLPRTLGPFGKLDDAKAEADSLRQAAPAESPFAAKLREAPPLKKGASIAKLPKRAADEEPRARPPRPKPTPEPARLPAPSWLDGLPPDRASRARRLTVALEKLGIDDAERIVRTDVQTIEPAIAATLLRRFVRRRVDEAVTPILPTEAARALAEPVVAAVIEAVLAAVSEFDRDPSADDALPGWQLLDAPSEPSAKPRRIHLR